MATRPRTPQEYFQIYKDSITASGELRDFSEGSMLDILGGGFSLCVNEVAELMINEFRKTYFDTATEADLDALALDHFGARFARPQGTPSSVLVTFTRPDTTEAVNIPTGTVLETAPDAVGNVVTFLTDEVAVFAVGTDTVTVRATSTEVGLTQNVAAATITVIAEAFPFVVSVTNNDPASGASNPETDDEFRETIKQLIVALAGATKTAIRGALLAHPSIGFAEVEEHLREVVNYSRETNGPVGESYFIPDGVVYVADLAGEVSDGVVAIAENIVNGSRACGTFIPVLGARPVRVPITYQATLVAGSDLQGDITP